MKNRFQNCIAIVGIAFFTSAVPSLAQVADTIYTNGKIYTVDASQPLAEAMAIKDGRFLAVGSNADVEKLKGAGTEVINLRR